MKPRIFSIQQKGQIHSISFDAMASPCEILLESKNLKLVQNVAEKATAEVWRIQDKYSRYQADSLCSKINGSAGRAVPIDQETFDILSFADQCFRISQGMFDITSGVLRKVWHFDGSQNVPSETEINTILPCVGWEKVQWSKQQVTLPQEMELDFGGIGKEYAVDKVTQLIKQVSECSALINLGGDLAVSRPREDNKPWQVGIDLNGLQRQPKVVISFTEGAVATSGDANRFLLKEGKRLSHILNPKTGWPIADAPSSITVASSSCLNAGMASTLAMLEGNKAESFLQDNGFKHWLYRDKS